MEAAPPAPRDPAPHLPHPAAGDGQGPPRVPRLPLLDRAAPGAPLRGHPGALRRGVRARRHRGGEHRLGRRAGTGLELLRCRRTARVSSWIAGLAALVLLPLWSPAPASAALKAIPGFNQPVYATAPRGDAQRLFVLERRGMVRLVRHGRIRRRPFLDLRRQVRLPFPHNQFRDQSGAFSLAFAPDYRRSGRLYVLYTSRDKRVHVDEFRRSRGGASSRSRRTVLSFHQEGLDDLGGDLAFGPDGFLYISLGEGNHPERSQNPSVLNGKLLRIDPRPTGGQPYGIPASNPFVMRPGTRPEIFAS